MSLQFNLTRAKDEGGGKVVASEARISHFAGGAQRLAQLGELDLGRLRRHAPHLRRSGWLMIYYPLPKGCALCGGARPYRC